jgi:aspartate aminotransferase-like enzyme
VPDEIDAAEFLLTLRDDHGIQLIGGQGALKGAVFRIGHIGWFDVFDICIALAGIEVVLAELGASIERGVAVSAALDAWSTAARV